MGRWLATGDRRKSVEAAISLADTSRCGMDAETWMGWPLSRPGIRCLRTDHGVQQYEPSGRGIDQTVDGNPGLPALVRCRFWQRCDHAAQDRTCAGDLRALNRFARCAV